MPLGLLTIALLLGASWALRHVLPVPPGLEIAALPAPPPPPLPAAPDPSAALEAAIAAAQAQEPRLRATLASLREDAATRLALCKPPEPPKPPKPPEPQVAAKPPDPPKPPDDRMRMPDKPTGDYSFLKGCWRTDPFKHRPEHTESGVSTYCFDDKGRGTLTFRRGARTCRTPATARFEGGTLRIKDGDTTCSDGAAWSQDRLDCTRGADDVAICRGEAQGPTGMDRWQVRLHRQK
ncbi:MAG: hypothetical protein JNL07_10845 [Rhodospirillales bacterium]|nr:hypothetical protein [Rhodospirillales bacterium]